MCIVCRLGSLYSVCMWQTGFLVLCMHVADWVPCIVYACGRLGSLYSVCMWQTGFLVLQLYVHVVYDAVFTSQNLCDSPNYYT